MAKDAKEPTTRAALRRRMPEGPTALVDLAAHAAQLEGVRRDDLARGDWLAVRTRNSWYSLFHLGDGCFLVSGGWFDQQGIAPASVTVGGCTWGGTAILPDLVACPGLFIEFGNGVTTTRVREVYLIRSGASRCDNTALGTAADTTFVELPSITLALN